jgi:putative flippase GtrA
MENLIDNQVQSNTLKLKITAFLEKKPVIYQFFRFVCIGFLNTALNFLILNSISKFLNIDRGWSLGGVSVISFCAAVIQSYLWNRTWTFGNEMGVTLWKNVTRLILVGALGVIGIIFVLIGSRFSAPAIFFALALIVYLIFESVLWKVFGFHLSDWDHEGHSFVVFFIVTLIGLGINFSLISFISENLRLTGSDLDKNIAAALATGVSLFWNFTGYKVIVFRK